MLLNSEFEMKDLGYARKILGMEIKRDRSKGKLFLSQKKYMRKVLEVFGMDNAKPVNYSWHLTLGCTIYSAPKQKLESKT